MDYHEEEPYYILPPAIEDADVNQEAELLRLMGKRPNKAIIRAKLSYKHRRELLFSDDAKDAQPAFLTPIISADVFEAITDWALAQNTLIAERIFDFLEDPSEDLLKDLLKQLRQAGLVQEVAKAPKTSTNNSLTQLVLRSLSTGAQPIEELYELARVSINSQRPEAALRQLLRRLVRSGQIIDLGNKIFSLA